MSPYKKALMPALFCTALILSGCAGSDLAAWNQKSVMPPIRWPAAVLIVLMTVTCHG